jgi:predicted ATPase
VTGAVGLEIHRAARISAAAHGRQVVVSATTRALASEGFLLEDLGEHRLKDFPQPERLFHLVVGDLTRDAFKPLRTLPVRPTNIPALESSLIGREVEVDRIRDLLSGEAHLVTLTGRGGTGKTRLALAAGVELLDRFPGGTWFVPLADVVDAERLLTAVAERLGVAEDGGASLLDVIAERLEKAPTLLILDNLEQLPDAAETIGRVLSAAPSVRVLATSQIPLQLTREHIVALAPLPSESGVRLFLEQAARRSDHGATDGSLDTIAAICERLDGLPLAIELAAARTVALTPDELLARLTDSLGLLTSRERDRPERQRSLRATIEWSLGLLESEDAELFATLSVFAGTFTLADAVSVAGTDVLDGLEALVEFSFVRRIATEDHAARFTVAQSLREFGREQLVAAGRLEAAGSAHARWMLKRAEALWEAMITDAPVALPPTVGMGDDVRADLSFLRQRDPPLHLQLIGAYASVATELAAAASLAAELDHAIAAASAPGPMLTRARLIAGEIAGFRGQREISIMHTTLARELALEHDPPVIRVLALMNMSYAKLNSDPPGARALAEQAVAESREAGGRAWAVLALAQVDVADGRVEVEPLLAELLATETNLACLSMLRHLYADCALLREDGPTAVTRYANALRGRVTASWDINPADLEGLAMALAVLERPQDALEVDAIADAHRAALGTAGEKAVFWQALRARHLDPIRAATPPPLNPATVTDLIAGRERALALAEVEGLAAPGSAPRS